MTFSDRLNEFIRENHISKSAVAKDMGIDTAKLNATVNGKRKMDVDEFSKFCKVVKVNPLKFLEP